MAPPNPSPSPPLTDPLLPESAPFAPEQRAWLNGYLAGLLAADRLVVPGAATIQAVPTKSLLILFGSQTGTSEALASRFARQAKKMGFAARALGMEEHAKVDLLAEKTIAVVTSTYGDGEMPDNAQAFWKRLAAADAPRLEHMEYAVLGLGDTNYAKFCQAGKDFDLRLEQLGAKRLHDRVDCDVEYEAKAAQWFDELMKALGNSALQAAVVPDTEPAPAGPKFSKANPFPARLKTNRRLNGPGSAKDTRHIEIVLAGSDLAYEVGDALGVVPCNCPDFVSEILGSCGLDGEEPVKTPGGREKPLRLALVEDFDLKPFIAELPPAGASAAELTAGLRRIPPRLYSISSSPRMHPGEVHLTLGVVRFEVNGRPRKGVCSTFLADRVAADTPVPVFVHASPGFKLPADPTVPIIMVGPGTGVAPFRAFLEDRRVTGATGRNWLLFGDQRSATDFLYREELEAWRADGFLTRLDVAFSRDQADKVYVQHRMRESAYELWTWLEEGAHFYVCGDASRMAKDVDAALLEACRIAAGLSEEAAADYVGKLKAAKRYCRDVY
jgi:sulfite reductase (NADPH) flavoprotein alpha-component